MLSRRLLATTCVLALFATPGLSQTTPTAPTSALRQTGATLTPPANMRAALRAFGLERQSSTSRFTKGVITNDQAQFSALSFVDADGKRSTLENLTIVRETAAGANFGTFTLQGNAFLETDGSGMGSFRITGLRGGTNLLQSLSTASGPRAGNGSARRDGGTPVMFADSISVNNVTLNQTDADGLTIARAEQINFVNIAFGPQALGFDTMEMKNCDFDFKTMRATIKTVRMNGYASDAFPAIPSAGASAAFDLFKVALGGLSFEDMTYSFKGSAGKPSPLDTMSIGRLGVADIKDGFIGSFLLSGVKLNGGTGANAWEMGLAKLGLADLNMRYFSEMGSALAKLVPAEAGAPPRLPPRATPPPILLKDLLKAGPLDSGVSGLDMADFKVSIAGFDFSIDQIGLTQRRNNDGIAIAMDMIPTTMRLKWPEFGEGSTNPIAKIVEMMDVDDVALRFSGGATFEPSTDVVNVSNYQFEMINWGKVRMDFAVLGIAKLYSEKTLTDMVAAGASAQPKAGTPAKAQLNAMFALYKDVGIKSGRMELFDLGGLDRGTKLFMAMSRQNNPTLAVSAQEVRSQRDAWAQTARSEAGKKSSPLFLRQIALSGARWMENGGSITVQANPTSPILGGEFLGSAAPPVERWGFSVTHTPPLRPPATTPPTARR
jgi:hypothetical protein